MPGSAGDPQRDYLQWAARQNKSKLRVSESDRPRGMRFPDEAFEREMGQHQGGGHAPFPTGSEEKDDKKEATRQTTDKKKYESQRDMLVQVFHALTLEIRTTIQPNHNLPQELLKCVLLGGLLTSL